MSTEPTTLTRQQLLEANAEHARSIGYPQFWPSQGRCTSCGHDLVEQYGQAYATATFTGCPGCGISWCD